ncbi:hypothetical protein KKB43_02860 [Patescibacteria group bacterium]|nr:hypothetical protein [Patescibacteria group bacterium]MBU4579933.1 hypothetical protein [Patescibacteria group bacterium]
MNKREIEKFLKMGKRLEWEEQKLKQEILILQSFLEKMSFDDSGNKWFVVKHKRGICKFKNIEFIQAELKDEPHLNETSLKLCFYNISKGDFHIVANLKFSEILEISEIKPRKKIKRRKER